MPNKSPPFLVVGTPRSGTAWLARFLTYGGRECVHEPSRFWGSMDDVRRFLDQPGAAASDSGLTLRWREIVTHRPDVRLVVVRRPLVDVEASLARIGVWHVGMRRLLTTIDDALADLLTNHPAAVLAYSNQWLRYQLSPIFSYVGYGWLPPEHWEKHAPIRCECDVWAHMTDAARNPRLAVLYPELTQRAPRAA